MSEKNTTPVNKKISILADLWINYKNDDEFADFIEYNDLGLPLSYAIENDLVDSSPKAEAFILETWDLFMAALEIEDEGFDSLDDIFAFGA